MLKNLRGKILSFAAGLMVACGSMAVAGIVDNGDMTANNSIPSISDWMEEGDMLGWVSFNAISASAEDIAEGEPWLGIVSNNVEYSDTLFLRYAVAKANLPEDVTVQMLYFTERQKEYTYKAYEDCIAETAANKNEASKAIHHQKRYGTTDNFKAEYGICDMFRYPIVPKKATDYIYACAFVELEGEDGQIERVYSEPLKYSILDYAYDIKSNETQGATRKALVTELLHYAGALQTHYEYTEKMATDEYYHIRFTKDSGCVILDDITDEDAVATVCREKGAFAPTEEITVQAPAVDEYGKQFRHWEDESGNVYGNGDAWDNFTFKLNDYKENLKKVNEEGEEYYVTGITLKPVYELAFKFEERTKNADGTTKNYKITGYTGSATSITIPTMYKGKPVVQIADEAFRDNSTIKEVSIPEGIIFIGKRAFNECAALETVEIPASVTSIGKYAFLGNKKLTSISVAAENEKYKSINGNLYEVDGDNLTLIQYAAGKTETEFRVPYMVTKIADSAIKGARNLQKIYIPESVLTIEGNAISACATGTVIYYQVNCDRTGWVENWNPNNYGLKETEENW